MLLTAVAILHMPPMVRITALAVRMRARARARFINDRCLFMGKCLLTLTSDAANFGSVIN
jgi:K+-transporting ATPase A subunit